MNLLIVDDQRAIVESLRGGIDWSGLGFERVFTACSARRKPAWSCGILRLTYCSRILKCRRRTAWSCFDGPGKTFRIWWESSSTSHADFEYARTALSLKGFDYILQPARYEEVEQVMKKAAGQLEYTMKMRKMEKHSRLMSDQVNWILDLMVANAREGKMGKTVSCLRTFSSISVWIITAVSFGPYGYRFVILKRCPDRGMIRSYALCFVMCWMKFLLRSM